jgi:hypothetical protein
VRTCRFRTSPGRQRWIGVTSLLEIVEKQVSTRRSEIQTLGKNYENEMLKLGLQLSKPLPPSLLSDDWGV